MTDVIAKYKGAIQFVVWMIVGLGFIVYGLFQNDAAMIALGAGAIGLPGFSAATKGVTEEKVGRTTALNPSASDQ